MQDDRIILTMSSKRKLESELNELRTVKKPEITESIRRAREYGDLSENFEYQAARQAQGILNGRIAEIEAILDRAQVVEDEAAGGDTVGLGSIVELGELDEDGEEIEDEELEYTIVDAASADPANYRISYSSPVGQALMKHKVGDVVTVTLPMGKVRYRIKALRHD